MKNLLRTALLLAAFALSALADGTIGTGPDKPPPPPPPPAQTSFFQNTEGEDF